MKQSVTTKAVVKELEDASVPYRLEQTGSDHTKISFGERYEQFYITASSPSDTRRAPLNARSDIRRMLREQGYIDGPQEVEPQERALVSLQDGQPVCLSTDIAQQFDRAHKDVLRAIDKIREDAGSEFDERNFTPITYRDKKNREKPAFALSRDAFSLVVMSFTGQLATAWKVKYIEAFNSMECQLRAVSSAGDLTSVKADVETALDLVASLEERIGELPQEQPRQKPKRQFVRPSVLRRMGAR